MRYLMTLQLTGVDDVGVAPQTDDDDGFPTNRGGTVVLIVETGAEADRDVPWITVTQDEPIVPEALFDRANVEGASDRLRVFLADD